ncbi:DUF3320 domain-containing protein [Rhodococcus sp. PAMC28707]|uniref:DUF3320 domain-containing protein n=1 Tax=unclassified Rhodococcus (in: high G+C Gram-positive bacteria) TaxID=192944 RepID=UPI00109DAE8B|nr:MULTISPECIES: DUF3320 domain-containing protein [unclassified Rhodococcus (in: high G+C Gram-positive bacteria)]QCB51971.1 DUF3320 domain-containing protein [Rhodococcus sp. PAMC28705]QCB59859.1 DUF3320 domain-containing protein [Rhodococcus sp. PAMC28707]
MTKPEPTDATHRTEEGGLVVELFAHPAVNLALVHNGIPVITALSIRNASSQDAVDTHVSVQLFGRGHPISPEFDDVHDGALAPGSALQWDDFAEIVPEVDHLQELNESYPATIYVSVKHVWSRPIQLKVPIRVLAHNEWFNAPVYYSSLSAFVQPNTRAVSSVLAIASTLLEKQTGNSSLGGYQSGPERAAYIAGAIYEALRSKGIRYINPPASFERSGQKIRTTAQVLEERLGTCIDLAVTYAACLEAAGLRPVLWLKQGHAFAGFMREETNLASATVTDTNTMVNLVESNTVVPVEAQFYDPARTGTFASAVATARRHFASPETLLGVTAVTTARKDGIRPLLTQDDVVIETVNDDSDTEADGIELPSDLVRAAAEHDAVFDPTDNSPARVQKWKRSLLDLSTRNRLLNLKAAKEVIDLHIPKSGLAILDDLVHADVAIELMPNDEISDIHELRGARLAQNIDNDVLLEYLQKSKKLYAAVTKAKYATQLKSLQRSARTMFEETGSANLYLTFGALIHTTSTGREARAPLFLLPVRITGGTGNAPFKVAIDSSEISNPNYCLVEWLRLKHNASIPALQNPPTDDSGIDIDLALQQIRGSLVEHNLSFRIDECTSLGICQFGTFGMWKDLDEHWETLQKSPIVHHLVHSAGESFVDNARPKGQDLDNVPVEEIDVPVPIPADGSQLRAVALAADGHSFVLEGPPGTGKSQTITNLIAHTLMQGKSVLFVAEKQAALDVVKRRLEKIGLSDFTLDLHGKNQRPQAIRDQLKKAIDLDAHYNERLWQASLATMRSRHAPLAEYPKALHEVNGAGQSVWSASDTAMGLTDGPTAVIPHSFVSQPPVPIADIEHSLRLFARSARTARPSTDNEWNLVGTLNDAVSEATLSTLASRMDRDLTSAHSSTFTHGALERANDAASLRDVADHAEQLSRFPVPSIELLDKASRKDWHGERDDLLRRITDFHNSVRIVSDTFTPLFVATGEIEPVVTAAADAGRGLMRKKRVEAFHRLVEPIVATGVSLSPEQALPLLQTLPYARSDALDVTGRMTDLLLDFAPQWWSPFDPNAAAHLQPLIEHVENTSSLRRNDPASWSFLVECGSISETDIATVRSLAAGWTEWVAALGSTPESLARWLSSDPWQHKWSKDCRRWVDSLGVDGIHTVQQYSSTTTYLDPLRSAGLQDFVNQLLSGSVSSSDAELSFIRGVASTSAQERRRRAGLVHFDPEQRYGEVDDFSAAADAQRKEQVVALRSLLLGRRPFKAGQLTDEVGKLRRLLDAKRGGQTFRQLITRYPDHIVSATPCFFVSPTSLAQFVPPGTVTFDVVVFDEASQVTVPQAVGALGRGRSGVIVGDSQQMPPTAVGKATAGDGDDVLDDEEVVPEDLDSILSEAVESGIPRQWLSWHYRSQDESLIAFSNEKYYEGRLASLPTPGGNDSLGVEWRRVQGHFNRENTKQRHRTNLVEAEAIVGEVRKRLANAHTANESIGIVTFNAQQQTLVRDLLEECRDPLVAEHLREDKEDGLFVKNLENVQGDERDVILFSTAFSKKPGDSKLVLNFGPLTRAGGEKRWNVAITRARRKVIVFTSFDPADIDLNRTNSVGMAHLRGYLERTAQISEVTESDVRWESVDAVLRSLGTALIERGYEVRPRYGLSDFVLDLVVRQPGNSHWQVAVLTDGPQWAKRPTVSDRDMTPLLLQSMMGWGGLVRVWLPEWIDNPDAVLDRISEALARAAQSDEERAATRDSDAEDWQASLEELTATAAPESLDRGFDEPVDLEPKDASAPVKPDLEAARIASAIEEQHQIRLSTTRNIHEKSALYLEAPTTRLGSREDLERDKSPSVRATIVDAIRAVVEIEGPIEVDRLCRQIGTRFGFDRLRAARKESIERCIPAELVRSGRGGDFVWPAGLDSEQWRGFRITQSAITRPLGEISPEEIANAMMFVADGNALAQSDLFRQTLAQFNQKRLTEQTAERLRLCLDLALRTSRMMQVGELYASGA